MSEKSGGEARAPRSGTGCFGWSQRHVDGGVVVHVAGELDACVSAELRRRLMNVVESGRGATIVLDLSDLRFIDARCVGVIVSAWSAARSRDRRLEVAGLRGIPARVFSVLGLERLVAAEMCEGTAGSDAGGRHERANGVTPQWRLVGGADGAG